MLITMGRFLNAILIGPLVTIEMILHYVECGDDYIRGYYRCSSAKGCSARKQVERSRRDPSMLIITYTSDHNHSTVGSSSSSSKIKDGGSIGISGINHDPCMINSTNNDHEAPKLGLISNDTGGGGGGDEDRDEEELSRINDTMISANDRGPITISDGGGYNNLFSSIVNSPRTANSHHHSTIHNYDDLGGINGGGMINGDHGMRSFISYNEGGIHGNAHGNEGVGAAESGMMNDNDDDGDYHGGFVVLDEEEEADENDDFFSELGMLPELASIFNKRDINNIEQRSDPDEIRSIGLNHSLSSLNHGSIGPNHRHQNGFFSTLN